jgi:hypothetical protein
VGRCNVYDLHLDGPLRHPGQTGHTVADVLSPLLAPRRRGRASHRTAAAVVNPVHQDVAELAQVAS